ncbi:MAG: DUF6544 family protein [Chloroflexota bacterium]|nr:DUF6544 family protein [Chloroflexota bacterium]
MDIIIIILVAFIAFLVLLWLGLKVKPRPFAPYPARTPDMEMLQLPDDLHAPVERFYRLVYGNQIPIIKSAVISGRAKLRFFGLTFQGRFRFIHIAGKDYRHYIEATLFGFPLMKVNEYYLDGEGRLELPFGVIEDEHKINQAANQGLWAESFWLPSILITDPRIRWKSVDDDSAILIVPFIEDTEQFVCRFDPQSGMPQFLETMRYRDADDEQKILWINEVLVWREIDDMLSLAVGAVTWFDQGKPWAVFNAEEIVYNVDVSEAIRARGV